MHINRTIIAFLWAVTVFFTAGCATGNRPETVAVNPLETILAGKPEAFGPIVQNADRHRLQIIFTQIDRDQNNSPRFTTHTYRYRPREYYYPASTIKLPAAALALEKLHRMAIPGVDRDTYLLVDSSYSGQRVTDHDSTSATGLPSIGHYVHQALIVSDNEAFNRLYEFLGQQYLNERLWAKSYSSARFVHRLSIALSPEENRHTNPCIFYGDDGIIHWQEEQYNPVEYDLPADDYILGKGELRGEAVVLEPKDFRHKNFITMLDYQRLLIALIFPAAVPPEQRFDLTAADRQLLLRSMSMLPRESRFPRYDAEHYWDSYVKFFMFGNSKEPLPENIRIFNKVGEAYGFLIDHAYIVDFANGVEFFLSAVLYVNENEILNDGVYEYDQVGFPFLHELGLAVYEYERVRPRKFAPDLSAFKLDYGE
ncbi:MAG: serine hydrolase [Candidatus Neomarinimicrobiota bacterium]